MSPENRSRHPFTIFFGWWIVLAVTLISAIVSGATGRSFTAIFQPMADEFGWSYAQVSFAASIRSMEGPLFAPLVGFLFDRWGPRRWIFIGVLISGLSLLLLSRIHSLTALYASSFIMAMGVSTCTGMLPSVTVNKWFRKRAGLAISIVLCGGPLGGLLVPLVTQINDASGWRDAMLYVGIGVLIICLPLTFLIRHKPEQYGYLPDGEAKKETVRHNVKPSMPANEVNFTARQALKSRVFWHLALVMLSGMVAASAIMVHVMPYLTSVGITRSTASWVAMLYPVTCIVPRIGLGWIMDRFDKKWLGTLACLSTAAGILSFGYVGITGEWTIVLFLIFYGIGNGGMVPILVALQREYFGTARLGSIMGLMSGLAVLGAMAGPPAVGWLFDHYGNYQIAWYAVTALAAAGVIFMVTAPATNKVSPQAKKIETS